MLEFCFDTVQQETGHWSCLFVALHQLPVVLQIHEPKQRATRRSVVRLPFLMTRSLSREYLKPPIDFRGNHRQCAQEKALQLVIDGVVIFRQDFLDPQPIIFTRVVLFPPGHQICTKCKHYNHWKQLQVQFSRFWLTEFTVDGSSFEHGS